MKKGFVVSAVLYPLLVMFLVLVMGILAMGQNRRKILDNMKLEVSEESETDPEMSNSALYYKMKALEEAYAEMASRLSEERFEEIQADYEKKINAAKNQAISNATTSSNNYTNNSINNLTTTMNSMRTSLQSEISTAKTQAISTAKTQTKLESFPVGSIFTSTTSTNPSSYIGGTWEAYGEGRTLVGVGSGTDINSTSQTFTAGETDGEYKHKLTVSEIPSHSHSITKNVPFGIPYNNTSGSASGSGGGPYYKESYTPFSIGNTGGNGYHNNIQPYIVVYFWKRIA